MFYSSKSAILGIKSNDNNAKTAFAEWIIPIPKDIRKNISKISLNIRATRLQRGLWLHDARRTSVIEPFAEIRLNGKTLDVIRLNSIFTAEQVFSRALSYPLEHLLDDKERESDNWKVSLLAGGGAIWEVDEISVETITKHRRFKTGFWSGILIGAIVGGLFGWLISWLLNTLLSYL